MQKVKVVFFVDMLINDYDGASNTMFQLINRIPSEHFEFLFVYGMGPDCIAGFKCIRVCSLSVPKNKNYRFATTMFQKVALEKEIIVFDPDIIHIASPSLLGSYALKTANRMKIPVISIFHTNFISYVDYYLKHLPFLIDYIKNKVRNFLQSFYNRCDTVYVPSHTMIRELTAVGVKPEVIKLWERGIDTTVFSPSKRNRDYMRALTGNDNPCILFSSRLVWEKNLQTMIVLYQLAEKHQLNYNFIVAGDGVAAKALKKAMPNAVFLGYLVHEKLSVVYASSDVFFFPSVTETFGNVVLEAMACGLPCVIADSGGSQDFIQHGINGFKCNPYDAGDFLNRLSEIIEQPELAKRFSCNGMEVSKKYNWEKLASQYFEELMSLACKSSAFKR